MIEQEEFEFQDTFEFKDDDTHERFLALKDRAKASFTKKDFLTAY